MGEHPPPPVDGGGSNSSGETLLTLFDCFCDSEEVVEGGDVEDDDVELEVVRGMYEAPAPPPAMDALYRRNADGSLPGACLVFNIFSFFKNAFGRYIHMSYFWGY